MGISLYTPKSLLLFDDKLVNIIIYCTDYVSYCCKQYVPYIVLLPYPPNLSCRGSRCHVEAQTFP